MATEKERLAPSLETEALDEAAAAEPGRTSALAALEYRDFRLFWIGLVVSNVGTWMQQFGLGWLVVQLAIRDGVPHLAPFYLGLVGLSRAVPGLAFGLFGGAVADRADRRRLLLVTQTSAATAARPAQRPPTDARVDPRGARLHSRRPRPAVGRRAEHRDGALHTAVHPAPAGRGAAPERGRARAVVAPRGIRDRSARRRAH